MPTIIAGVVIGLLVFLGTSKLLKKVSPDKGLERTKRTLRDLKDTSSLDSEEISILKEEKSNPFVEKICHSIPTMGGLYDLTLKSGVGVGVGFWIVVQIIFTVIAYFGFLFFSGIWWVALIGALFIGHTIPRKFLQGRIKSRSTKFLNLFPDAIDMIVRSVRSGHPVNASLKMIAENMDPPVSTEFKQVVDEVSFGSPLPESLAKMSRRVGEQDIAFFVVVLSVQQETGGNLAEVLTNLSNIIRKRKMMRLKIKAMTSEGRMTAWMLGVIPIFFMGAIYFASEGYLDPLFQPGIGRYILFAAAGLVFLAVWIVKKMLNVDI